MIVAGGGTGGHFFCGVAFAEAFLERYPQSKVVFVGVRQGIEARTHLSDPRMSIRFVQARGVLGKSVFDKVFALFTILGGFFQALGILWSVRPRLVLGVGGYASVPVILAAWMTRPLMRWNIRVIDQNSVPGLANRLFARLGIPAYSGFASPGFREIDLPVRRALRRPQEGARDFVWPPKNILVMGGSQGAKALNQAWIRLLPDLRNFDPDIQVFHQTGAHSLENCRSAYENFQIRAECFVFSDKMADYYQAADLIIARAGALSVFEIMEHQRPCIFVPFPFATHQHQLRNAEAVQSSDWILLETDLKWSKLERLFNSDRPKLPKRRQGVGLQWESVIQA